MNMSIYKNPGKEEKEKDFINIKKIKLGKNYNDIADNDYEEEKDDKRDDNAGLYTLIKREQILLRVSYKKYLSKEHKNILSIFLAEILDKVYLVKICLFLKEKIGTKTFKLFWRKTQKQKFTQKKFQRC